MMSDDITDLSIAITDRLVELGVIPDCIDTLDMTEFDVQDEIERTIIQFNKKELE